MIKFKAAVLEKSKSQLEIKEITHSGSLEAGQVLVKVLYSGICGAQINEIDAVKGEDKFLPHLLGHEGVGIVKDVGELVNHVQRDDLVVMHWMPGQGIQSKPPVYKSKDKKINAGWVTTFNEYAVISGNRCTKIFKQKLKLELLPLLGCSATTALGVLENDASVKIGESICVIGVGGVGLFCILLASSMGAYPVIAIDRNEKNLEQARELGAHFCIKVEDKETKQSVENKIKNLLTNKNIDVIIESTGNSKMIEVAYNLAQPKSRAILVGVPNINQEIKINTLPLHFGMKFVGSKGGQSKPESDIQRLINLYEFGKFSIDKMKIKILSLNEINQGIEELRTGFPGRIIIKMD
jgi:S-(hydroxymethyl)glutathione dehydrogenase/alcohol dehydrogenase